MTKSKLNIEQAIQEYKAGKSYEELRKEWGFNNVTWRKYVIPILKERGIHRDRAAAIRLAAKQGKMRRDIRGEKNPCWKGGRVSLSYGYIGVLNPGHPRANPSGYVREHILIWEQVHNQPLPKGWSIHHLNGILTDNRPENLVAMPTKKHDNYIPILKKRIRALEAENNRLHRALETGQFILFSES